MAYLIVNIAVHHQCIDNVRNGIYMMRHVHFNPNAFSHPVTGFLLGLLNVILFVIIETVNVISTLSRINIDVILSRFVSYAILLQVPQIYVRQRKAFNIKFDVEDFFLTINRENIDEYMHTP